MTTTTPEAVAALDLTPWENYHGDLPDYDHPLRPVYESGIQYAVELLAKELGVSDYEVCDGTEEFDGDLGGTMLNIVFAAMPKDENGDPIGPKEAADTLTALSAERDALAERMKVLEGKLDMLQMREAAYRSAHDLHGDGSMKAGAAWDAMRHAGNQARAALKGKDNGDL